MVLNFGVLKILEEISGCPPLFVRLSSMRYEMNVELDLKCKKDAKNFFWYEL